MSLLPRPGKALLPLVFASLLLAAAATRGSTPGAPATAKPAPPPPPTAPLPEEVRAKVERYFDRYCRLAPNRRIEVGVDPRIGPVGFVYVRATLDSTTDSLDQISYALITADWKFSFHGAPIKLDGGIENVGPDGARRLTTAMSGKIGTEVAVRMTGQRGPAGTYAVVLDGRSGELPSSFDGWVTPDGNWMLIGIFLPVDGDPRKERMTRIDFSGSPTRGPASAPVTIVEFSDFQCPRCRDRSIDVEKALEKWKGKVRFIHVDHPIWQIHDWTVAAAAGGRCMEKLVPGSYWAYRSAVFGIQPDIRKDKLDAQIGPIASSLGADLPSWIHCRSEGSILGRLGKELNDSYRLGIQSTPTLLVNGALIDDGIELLLDRAISDALAEKKAGSGGKAKAGKK